MRRVRTADGRYLYRDVSIGVADAFGLERDRLQDPEGVDHSWIDPRDRERFISALDTSAAQGTPLDVEVRVTMPDGGSKWIRSMGDPSRQDDGSTVWNGVALDITDRREALERVERAMETARAAEVAASSGATSERLGVDEAWVARLRSLLEEVGHALDGGREAAARDALGIAIGMLEAFPGTEGATPGMEGATRREPLASALTKRQRQIASSVASGHSNREIAERLELTEGTVKLHVSRILKRSGCRNRTELALAMAGSTGPEAGVG